VTLTSVGYGGRYPQTSGGKAIAMFAAMFGLFAQAMPLTIIGNTFYNIHINQERNRRKLHGKFKLRKAVFKISNRMVVYHHDSHHDENILLCNSGYEKLHKSLRMRREHYKIIDQYIGKCLPFCVVVLLCFAGVVLTFFVGFLHQCSWSNSDQQKRFACHQNQCTNGRIFKLARSSKWRVVWVLLGLGKLNDVDLFFPSPLFCFGCWGALHF
jgi:hypothetical protein